MISMILIDISFSHSDIRNSSITKKCFHELLTNLQSYLIFEKDQYGCEFVNSMVFIVCEFIEDLSLSNEDLRKFISKTLNIKEPPIWLLKATESLKLAFLNLLFKILTKDPD